MSDLRRKPDDDMLNAYIDGEATPEERALVESDASLEERIGLLRRVSEAVRVANPPSAATRERNVTGALAVFDASSDESGTGVEAPGLSSPRNTSGQAAQPPLSGMTGLGAATDINTARKRRNRRRLTAMSVAAITLVGFVIAATLLTRAITSVPVNEAAQVPRTAAKELIQTHDGSVVGSGAASEEGNGSPSRASVPTVSSPSPAPAGRPAEPPRATTGPTAGIAFVGDLGATSPGPQFRTLVGQQIEHLNAERAVGDLPSSDTGDGVTASEGSTKCQDAVRSTDPKLGPLVMVGSVLIDGTPSTVLAFAFVDPNDPTRVGHRAFAVASNCSIIDVETL